MYGCGNPGNMLGLYRPGISCYISFLKASLYIPPDTVTVRFPFYLTIPLLMADCFADAVSPCPPWRHAWSVHFLFGLALSAFAGFILSAVSRMRQRLRHFIRHLSNHPLSVWTSTMGQPFLRSGQYVHVQPHSHTQPRGGLFAVGTASK